MEQVIDYIGLSDFVGTLIVVALMMYQQQKAMQMLVQIFDGMKERDFERWQILADICRKSDGD